MLRRATALKRICDRQRVQNANGRGNPKFEKLYPLVRHLNIYADRIFYPESVTPQPNLQKLFIMLNDCTEQEVAELLPAVHYLLALMRKRDNSEQ